MTTIQLDAKTKYDRLILPKYGDQFGNCYVDVYAVLDAFNVPCPARQHAIKKLLCTGLRGKGDSLQDLKESVIAINRAIAMEEQRLDKKDKQGNA